MEIEALEAILMDDFKGFRLMHITIKKNSISFHCLLSNSEMLLTTFFMFGFSC